jgi:flagellar biosynthesis chaperone FliJ
MPITIGSLFRRIVKVLQTQDDNPNSYLNNPKSDFYNPNYDINNPSSNINNQHSRINDASNNQYNKERRRNALRKLIQIYLSDYLSAEQAEELVKEHIP